MIKAFGLVAWFSLRVQEVPSSIHGMTLRGSEVILTREKFFKLKKKNIFFIIQQQLSFLLQVFE